MDVRLSKITSERVSDYWKENAIGKKTRLERNHDLKSLFIQMLWESQEIEVAMKS